MLRRYLEYRGYQVKHAMNLGDIDDRTVKECLKAGEKLRDFTARWERVFFETLDTLRVKRAHHYPKASEHVDDMVEQTRSLLEKGLAYEKLRSVYFRIGSFPGYGRLSGIEPKQMRSEASTTYDYYEKDHPGDFALFKRPTLAELKAGHLLAHPLGQRPARLARRMRLHGRALPRPADGHPHGQHRSDVSPRRQRNRHRLRPEGQAAGQALDALRSGHGRRKEGQPCGRQRPHAGQPAGTRLRRADGPLLAPGHALPHGAALLARRASAGRAVRRAAQRVRRAAASISSRAGAAPTWTRPSTTPVPAGTTRWTTI